MEKHQKI